MKRGLLLFFIISLFPVVAQANVSFMNDLSPGCYNPAVLISVPSVVHRYEFPRNELYNRL